MRIQNQNGTWSKTHYSEQDVNISRGAIPEFVLLWHSFCPLRIYRLYRPWRTTTRKCCLSTGTLDLLAWSLRILSSPSATSPPISPHTRSNWAGTARTWPHTSTCCLRPPGSSGSRHSTCHASLLCWVRSSTNSHTNTANQTCITLFSDALSLKHTLQPVICIFGSPLRLSSLFIDTTNIWECSFLAGNHILPDEDLAAFHWSLLGPEHPLASLKVCF